MADVNQSAIRCRSCSSTNLNTVLSLGHTPLANALLTAEQIEQPEEKYPLELVLCSSCALLQITETVPPEKLFSEYLYFSSFSDTMLRHAQELAKRNIEALGLNEGSLVLEIASNDGYLLQYYKRAGIQVLGIEPAKNVASVANNRGIRTVSEFFSEEIASRYAEQGVRAQVIHAHNVLAHVPDLNGFVRGINALLSGNGIAVIEVPYVRDMVERCEFDTIYHEHLCYFSLTALDRLFKRNNLAMTDVERVPIHGGSLRIFAEKQRDETERKPAVAEMLDEEAALGLELPTFYKGINERVIGLRDDIWKLLHQIKNEGKRIAVYGASAKGATFLNFLGLGRNMLEFVADRSTVKQGYYTPGTHLQIVSPDRLLETMPDYVLLLTWNFADEILDQQSEYSARGGHFIIPIPELRVV